MIVKPDFEFLLLDFELLEHPHKYKCGFGLVFLQSITRFRLRFGLDNRGETTLFFILIL